MARAKRSGTPGDMLRTMAVILVPLLLITFFATRNLDDAPVTVVDWRPVLTLAREESPYPGAAPTALPPQWRATRVSWVKEGAPSLNGAPAPRNTWRLGFLSPEDVFISVNQGDAEAAEFIKDETREGLADGQSTVDGQKWDRFVTSDERTRSLVRQTDGVTTIVVGDASYEALDSFAATLQSA